MKDQRSPFSLGLISSLIEVNPFFFRKRRYAGVVFTRFCDLWFLCFFLKMLVVLKNVSSKNVDL